jgi:biofilm PGA synthesis N-glycosyltransferase PgaC
MKNKLTTISIGIPAHNEENSILKLLKSVMRQSQKSFTLEKVYVVCDGCTDNTSEKVKKFAKSTKKIILMDDGERKGKAARINEIFKTNMSEILICIDADVILSKNCIDYIIKPFQNKEVSLVGGCDIPHTGKSVPERVSVAWIKHWQSLVRQVNHFDNPTNCPGRMYALRKGFSKSFTIPTNIVADDHFVFFMSKEKKTKFEFAPNATIYFQAPKSLQDFVKQSVRFGKSGEDVRKLFKKQNQDYSSITIEAKLKGYLSSFINEPIYFTVAVLVQTYIRLTYNWDTRTYTKGQWESINK